MKTSLRFCLVLLTALAGVLPHGLRAQDSEAPDSVEVQEPEEPQEAREITAARILVDSVGLLIVDMEDLASRRRGASTADQQLIRVHSVRQLTALVRLVEQGSSTLALPWADSLAVADSLRSGLEAGVEWLVTGLDVAIQMQRSSVDSLWNARAAMAPEDRVSVDEQILRESRLFDQGLGWGVDVLETSSALGLEYLEEGERIDGAVQDRAPDLVGRLQLAIEERSELQRRLREGTRAGVIGGEMASIRYQVEEVQGRIRSMAGSLSQTAALLDRRGFESARYRQFVIQATGEVSQDVLNIAVLRGLVAALAQEAVDWIENNFLTLVVRFLILIVFMLLFRLITKIVWHTSKRVRHGMLSELAEDLGGRWLPRMGGFIGLLVGLGTIGVDPTTLVAGVGVASVIIGLALQDSMSNLAAGFFILFNRPYDVNDDVIVGGVRGKVEGMGLAATTIVTLDHRRLLVPNRKIWGDIIENRSSERIRRVETEIRIGLEEDFERARQIILGVIAAREEPLEEPGPTVFVEGFEHSWMEVKVWCWTSREDWWQLTMDLPSEIWKKLREEGMQPPYSKTEILRDSATEGPPPGA